MRQTKHSPKKKPSYVFCSFALPPELKAKMASCKTVNWSAVLREAVERFIERNRHNG